MSDEKEPSELPDIEQLFARMAPAQTPNEALNYSETMAGLVASLDPLRSVEVFSGLMTDPSYQAHQVRLDYAVRIILGAGNGHRRLKRAEIIDLLNNQLELGRVARLEDPIEDFFVESLPTRYGQYLIFSGGWEKASVHTELILEAFRRLPDGPPKQAAWASALAILRLSNVLVDRSGLERGVVGEGAPGANMEIPSDHRLNSLAKRVRFSTEELAGLGITLSELEPFFLLKSDKELILIEEPGNSPLEFRPLIRTSRKTVS
jgi:hypothetical protein